MMELKKKKKKKKLKTLFPTSEWKDEAAALYLFRRGFFFSVVFHYHGEV